MNILYISAPLPSGKAGAKAKQEATAQMKRRSSLIKSMTNKGHMVKETDSLAVAEYNYLIGHGLYHAIITAKRPRSQASKAAAFNSTLHFLERMLAEGKIKRAIVLDQGFTNEEIERAQKTGIRLIRLNGEMRIICAEISIALRIDLVYPETEG